MYHLKVIVEEIRGVRDGSEEQRKQYPFLWLKLHSALLDLFLNIVNIKNQSFILKIKCYLYESHPAIHRRELEAQ